jgi:hypothetical protein
MMNRIYGLSDFGHRQRIVTLLSVEELFLGKCIVASWGAFSSDTTVMSILASKLRNSCEEVKDSR